MANAIQRLGQKFLGISIKDNQTQNTQHTNKILTTNEDGSTIIEGVGPIANYGYWSANYSFNTEIDLINKFRDMSINTYCDRIINEIVNTCVSFEDETGCTIELNLDQTDYSDNVKNKIQEEWVKILTLLDFKNNGQSIFRDWYIDGRIYYQKIVNKDDLSKGLVELRRIDSTEIKKIKQIERRVDEETGALIIEEEKEFFLYSPQYSNSVTGATGQEVLLNLDAVAYSTSGLYVYKEEPNNSLVNKSTSNTIHNRFVVSYLYPIIKPLNQLNIVEEAGLINLVARAPARRIHYVDVAGLPKSKADEAMRDYAKGIKNDLQYDTTTGTFNSDVNIMTMQDDLIIPRRNGTNAAQIEQLPGVQTNNNVEIIEYFKKKLYMASHVALSRMENDSPSFLGRSTEINRDELNMSKFCNNLRMKFAELPLDLLKTQLLLKNIVDISDWNMNKGRIITTFSTDTFISQLREIQITQEKVAALRDVEPYIGRFYSNNYVRKHILGFNDIEIADMKEDMKKEQKEEGSMGGMMGQGMPGMNTMGSEQHETTPTSQPKPIM